MELNSVINNDELSVKMKDIYKFIDKNENKINTIFIRTYNDIKNLYPDISLIENTIEFVCKKGNITSVRNEMQSILSYHAKEVLKDNSYLLPYAFKVSIASNTITITKRH